MDKIQKYAINEEGFDIGRGYEKYEDGEVMFSEDVEERLKEIKSRLCSCEYPKNDFECHCCRIIKHLFGDISED